MAGAVVVVVAVALLVGLVHRDDSGTVPIALDQTGRLPAIVGTDLVSGDRIDLATLRGKPVFINAWAEWCLECREEAPVLKRFAAAHPEITMIGIVGNSARRYALEVNRELGWPWPSLFDPDGKIVLTTLGVQNYPTTLFVDADGVLRGRKRGVVTAAELDDVAMRLG